MQIDASSAAAGLLDAAWNGRFPVDPVQIAKKIGVQVYSDTLPESVSGAIIKKPGSDAIILIEQKDSSNRQRFTCAHELGHFVDELQNNGEEYNEFEHIDLRSDMARRGTDPKEIFANEFAASLLMPEEEVKKRYVKDKSTMSLSICFGVSPQAMQFRLKKLRLA